MLRGWQMGDSGGIQLSFAERQSEMPQSSRSGIPLIIHDPDLRRPIIGSDAPSPAKAMQQLLTTEKPPVEGVFQPEFLRLVPPLHDCDGEGTAALIFGSRVLGSLDDRLDAFSDHAQRVLR
ncbi:hypothetical protein HPB51_008002 [Rhipicephalus microplus]|uniref:Uncharacterized protein n=1 Tax=Rhipicephalus microplus TaxID=6941 RepID=A0A9J6DFU4_RHIMP|nr:hypothetical protein HPB51_008002 [Rhipicephalus microplus]